MKKITALCVGLCITLSTQAHMLWLERTPDQQTKLFFGELSEQALETQQGSLKYFNDVLVVQNQQKIKASAQNTDHLIYPTKGNADVNLNYEVVYEDALLRYFAKTGRSHLTAESVLDIVPTQTNSNTFTVYYQGKPAADVKISVFSPQHWEKKYTSNAQGKITIETPWKGQYIIEVSKESDQAGTFNQQAYKKQYLVTTLSFIH